MTTGRGKLAALILLAVAGLAAACDRNVPQVTPQPADRIFRDDLGRDVKMPERVERAISLAPSVTELIFAAGAGDRLAGVTTYCNYPEAAKAVEKVGDTQTPNIERIIALKPDVVFISKASQLEAFMHTLDQRGVAVYVTDPKSIGEVIGDLETFGRMFGTEEKSGAAAADLRRRADEVSELVRGSEMPKVFVQISKEPLFTVGKGSFVLEVVRMAGGELVTKNVPSAFPKLSKESASAMAPDVIILSDSEDNQQPNDVFLHSPAVKSGRVHKINADVISRPGPRLVDAAETIARFLHSN